MTTTQTTIYGASDDLIEFEGAIDGEMNGWGAPKAVVLSAPNGETLELLIGFCDEALKPEGWGVRIDHSGQQAPWPIVFTARSDEGYVDPAITITHPEGTTATCDGEDVQ